MGPPLAVAAVAVAVATFAADGPPQSSAVRHPPVTQASAPANRAEALLGEVRDSLGGRRALAAVTTLEVAWTVERLPDAVPSSGTIVHSARSEPFRFKMRWPDCYQQIRTSFIHTLVGADFWMLQTGGPPIPVGPDLEATARRSTEATSAYLMLEFLLRVPPSRHWSPRDVGATKAGGVEGPTVEFVGPSGSGPRMVFDGTRRMPVAFVTTARHFDASGERNVQVVTRLEDYRRVDGLLFPFRLDERSPGQLDVRRVTAIRVNPRFGPREFAKPAR